MTTTQYGGMCYTADAIVPIPDDGTCEWCGGAHLRRYVWTWAADPLNRWEWRSIPLDDPLPRVLLEKPENFSEDGI